MLGWLKKKLSKDTPAGSTPGRTDQKTGNEAVRAQLANMGDDGTKVRHVIHFAYPLEAREPVDKDEIIALLKDADPEFETKPAAQGGGVVFEHYREVASENFDEFTVALDEVMDSHGWDYDGWECAVMKDEEEGEE